MEKFTVVIVEDEPPIARYIKTILDNMGMFHVLAVCEDGFEGIKVIETESVDILITDIQMPGMTGLEVIRRVKDINPQIIPVIISGHKKFEYAQEAIKLEAYDYLVKPLDKEKIKQVLEGIWEKLQKKYTENANLLLEQQLSEGRLQGKILERCFPFPYFEALMISYKSMIQKEELIRNLKGDELSQNSKKMYVVDYKGTLLILVGTQKYKNYAVHIKAKIDYLMQNASNDAFSFCGVVTRAEYSVEELEMTVKKMYRSLNAHMYYGNSFFFGLEDPCEPEVESAEELIIQQRMYRHLSTKMWDLFKEEYIDLFTLWEKQKNTQQHIYNKIQVVLKKINQLVGAENNFASIQEEVYDLIQCSNSYGEAMSSIWEIFTEKIYKDSSGSRIVNKRSMETLYNSIIQYIHENIGENLFLTEICDLFGVSQPYVSKLFRRYAGLSYKEYVLKMKIGIAIEMLEKIPNILIKDIAQELGFENPLYFSSVFKNIVGVSPSQFIRERGNGMKKE